MYQNYTQPARFTHKTNRRVGIERKRKRQTKRRENERERARERGGEEESEREREQSNLYGHKTRKNIRII